MQPTEIKKARQALGLTQQQLADKIGNHVSTVAGWEQGTSKIAPGAAAYLQQEMERREFMEIVRGLNPTEVKELLEVGRAAVKAAQGQMSRDEFSRLVQAAA